VTYNDQEVEEVVPITNLLSDPPPPETTPHIVERIVLKTTDPRFPTDGDVILTTDELHTLLTQQQLIPDQKVWVTTSDSPSRKRKKRYIMKYTIGKERRRHDSYIQSLEPGQTSEQGRSHRTQPHQNTTNRHKTRR